MLLPPSSTRQPRDIARASPRAPGRFDCLHFRELSGLYVVDEATNLGIGRNKGTPAQKLDVIPDALLEVGEGEEVDATRVRTKLFLDLLVEIVIGEGEHAALGVMHHGDRRRTQEPLRDHKGADRILSSPAGIPNH